MRNACIVYNNNQNENRYYPIIDVFRQNGYAFDENRVLLKYDLEHFRGVLGQMKPIYDNLILIADVKDFLALKSIVVGLYAENSHSNADGGGVFSDKGKTLMLLSFSAEEYVRSVCLPFLAQKYGVRRERLVIRTMGANEQHVERLLAQAKALDKNRTIDCLRVREYDEDVISIFYGENTPKMLLDDVLRQFAEGLSDTVYAMDDTPLPVQIVRLLKLRGKKLSVAESFTGGGIARAITSVSGASEVYFEGINAYNELSKMKRLGVSQYTLKTSGAVSQETAYEMATGLLASGDCDIAIATTGLAGPNTDRSMLPVGLSYIAVGMKESVFVYRYKFDGTREEITGKAIRYALFQAYKHLKNI